MIYSFLYVIVFSVALVLIQKLDISISPLFSLFITASIATLYFNFINRNNIYKIYNDSWKNRKQWLSVMCIVLIMWSTTMIGPGKIGASLFNFIYFAWLGVLGYFFSSFKNWQQFQYKFYFGILLLILLVSTVLIELHLSYSKNSFDGIGLALLGGTFSFIYFKQSQALAKSASLTATQVLAVRFYLSIIVLAIIMPKNHIENYFSIANSLSLTVLAFFSLIIPLYFSQKALEKITSEQHAIINSLCPIITGILQEIIFNDLKTEQLIIYLFYSFAIGLFFYIDKSFIKMEATK